MQTLPSEWKEGWEALRALPPGGVALLVGATDRGKTTFAAYAARALAAEFADSPDKRRVALVDADIGQGEIGPPGTVGVAWVSPETTKLSDLRANAVFFVGAFAPNMAALELAVAAGQATDTARSGGARIVLVDTAGWVSGPAARRLQIATAQAVRPSVILCFGPEAAALAAAMGVSVGVPVGYLGVPTEVGRKSSGVRTTRRLTRLSRALAGETPKSPSDASKTGREIALPLATVPVVGATLGTGEALPPALVRWAGEALRVPVLYAEQSDGILNVFTRGTVRSNWEQEAGPVATHFGVRTVRVLSLAAYAGAYVGLTGDAGRLLGVGICTGFDADRAALLVAAPFPITAERVRLVAFGRVRLNADGSFLNEIKPGEL